MTFPSLAQQTSPVRRLIYRHIEAMDQQTLGEAAAMDHHRVIESGRTSSVYSDREEQRPTHLNGSSGSRHANYTPSYMSNIAARSTEALTIQTTQSRNSSTTNPVSIPQQPQREAPELPTGPPATPGLLLILIANTIHPSTIFYLEMLLTRQSFSGIVFAASKSQEAALKQLKMDVYALIGRLRKEIGVTVHTNDSWSQSEVEAVVKDATKHGDVIQGVVCCPEFDESGTADTDILSLDSDQLDRSWKQSVAFIHAAIKATIVQLLSGCKPASAATNGIFVRGPQGPFFLVAGSTTYTSASQVTKSACDTLVVQLERATKAKGLTVGFTEAMLIPEPSRTPPPKPNDEVVLQPDTYSAAQQEDYDFTAGESPTKLWSSWALANDIGYVD